MAIKGYLRVMAQRPKDIHKLAKQIAETRMTSEALVFQGMALVAIGTQSWEIEPILTKPDGTARKKIGWDCGRDISGKRVNVETLTGIPRGSLNALLAGMTFAGACIDAGAEGADTTYTAKDWALIAARYGLLIPSDVVKIKPVVATWWLTGGGSAASLQSVIRKALV